MRTHLLLAALVATSTACQLDPGEPNYPDPSPYVDTSGGGGLPGDVPWDGSSPRLSLSAFYEGDASDVIVIDDQTVHYYIYDGSFSQQTSDERVEGFVSDQLTVSSSTYWGGGIHFDTARDLSGWSTLHVALRSPDAAMEAFQLGMVGSIGEGRANITDYGFVADDEWHVLRIPLANLASQVGFDSVTVGLLLISATAVPGTSLFVDDLYLTAGE